MWVGLANMLTYTSCSVVKAPVNKLAWSPRPRFCTFHVLYSFIDTTLKMTPHVRDILVWFKGVSRICCSVIIANG